jgi:hypothetical protein
MKNCKELNLPLCWDCAYYGRNFGAKSCSIIAYCHSLSKPGIIFEDVIMKNVKRGPIYGDTVENYLLYIRSAIEQVNPEYLPVLDKMLILL